MVMDVGPRKLYGSPEAARTNCLIGRDDRGRVLFFIRDKREPSD